MTQHKVQRIGYARVSTLDQNLARQLNSLGTVDRLFEEKQSGAQRAGRVALAELIGYTRDGDTVVVSSMDRLARSVVDLNQIVGELTAKGVSVEFIAERVTFAPGGADPFAEFQLNIMASFSQLERAITRERQADGIKAAQARGAYRGRARKLTDDQLAEVRALIDAGVPKAVVARRFTVDRTTLYRALSRTAAQ
ncbi:recombinase family protein [Arthrobacter echini]|uniref:Recombinase family protein n=1 Tax=Arthrobacter echini TaxID=1529066 RepID=A0A4S5E4X3_9MICC|nr:recombinase family protein [Arthrobacter echini]THJ66566.1 recombinase family protein [Arthrobacter echini]